MKPGDVVYRIAWTGEGKGTPVLVEAKVTELLGEDSWWDLRLTDARSGGELVYHDKGPGLVGRTSHAGSRYYETAADAWRAERELIQRRRDRLQRELEDAAAKSARVSEGLWLASQGSAS